MEKIEYLAVYYIEYQISTVYSVKSEHRGISGPVEQLDDASLASPPAQQLSVRPETIVILCRYCVANSALTQPVEDIGGPPFTVVPWLRVWIQ